jgi:hypothetical protein
MNLLKISFLSSKPIIKIKNIIEQSQKIMKKKMFITNIGWSSLSN